MRHLIQKQEFRFTTPFLEVQEWERRVNELLQRVITPAIEDCFDKASSDSSYHIIDRLEIDLGKIHKDISEQKIRDLVISQLTERLTNVSYKRNSSNTAHGNNYENGNGVAVKPVHIIQGKHIKEQPGHTGIDGKEEAGDHIITSSQANIKCLVHFLIHGTLPWWAETGSFQFKKEWLENSSDEELMMIKKVLYENEQARQRLVRQSGIDFISTLLRRFNPEGFPAAISTWKWLESISTVTSGRDLRALAYEYWFYWINKTTGIPAMTTALQRAIQQTTHFSNSSGIIHYLQNGNAVHEPVKEMIVQICHEIFAITADDDQSSSTGENKTVAENDAIIKSAHQNISPGQELLPVAKKIQLPGENKIDKTAKPATETDGLFAEDAGLALLHPFLQELFTGFDLLDEKKQWRSSTAQQTAVWLLVWLAHGETDIPEYRLIVPKLFCGMLWEDVLDTSIVLTEEHIRSSTEMMQAVITHWKTIGNTSPDGLREGFINRSGKITTTKDGWLIIVEKKAQDILLGRLPWGLSMIHFPWLDNRFIHVDWA